MESFFEHFYSNGALLVLWGALLFHAILPISHRNHPVILWHRFAEQLADKVNNHHSHSQSTLSGYLSLAMMLLPCWILLVALQPLVWQDQLFQMALLILALGWRQTDTLARECTQAMAKEDKVKTRQLLSEHVNRETNTLSLLGLGKASAETLIVGVGRNTIGVLFWYAIGGGIAALMYRLTVELARAWSPSRQRFMPFGRPAIQLTALLDFIPMRLFSVMVAFGRQSKQAFAGIRQQAQSWPLPGPAWLLCSIGNKLQIALGGPAIYDGKKMERAKIGGRIAPAALHLAQIRALLNWRVFLWIILQSLSMGLVYKGL